MRGFSLSKEACISNVASSDPFGREGGESRPLSLTKARHLWCTKTLPIAESYWRQEQNEETALKVLQQEVCLFSCMCPLVWWGHESQGCNGGVHRPSGRPLHVTSHDKSKTAAKEGKIQASLVDLKAEGFSWKGGARQCIRQPQDIAPWLLG